MNNVTIISILNFIKDFYYIYKTKKLFLILVLLNLIFLW